jgi:hypothetical protein
MVVEELEPEQLVELEQLGESFQVSKMPKFHPK